MGSVIIPGGFVLILRLHTPCCSNKFAWNRGIAEHPELEGTHMDHRAPNSWNFFLVPLVTFFKIAIFYCKLKFFRVFFGGGVVREGFGASLNSLGVFVGGVVREGLGCIL